MKIIERNTKKEWSFNIEIELKGVNVRIKGSLDKSIIKGYYDESDTYTRIKNIHLMNI